MNVQNPMSDAAQCRPARVFSVEAANRALVLVARIVADITARFQKYLALRQEIADASHDVKQRDACEAAKQRLVDVVQELQALQVELEAVGCQLKDWQIGLVDFPSQLDGRNVWLCWKQGEPSVSYWHEMNEGFAGRKKLADQAERTTRTAEE